MTQITQNGWIEKSLKELVNIFDSKRIPLSTGERAKRKGQFPYYGASNIVDYIDDFIFDGDYLLISEDGENLNTRNTPIAFLASGKFWVNNHAHIVRGKENHMTKYLYWYFSQLDISPYITGAVQPKLSKSNLESIRIKIPENPDEQRAIAAVLSSLDDKIELLREQNKTLEAMAQELFREWFTEFNFPDADGKPYKKSGSKMIDSELGEIPEGWRVGSLGEEFNITIGRTPPRGEAEWFSDIPIGKKWISIKDIGNSETYISNTSEYLTDEAVGKFNIPVIPEDTTILSFKMTVGKLAITTEKMLSNEAIAHLKIKENSNFSTEFIYLFLKGLNFNSLGSTSSIVTAINSTMIKEIEVIVPVGWMMQTFNKVIQPIFGKLKSNNSQRQILCTLRDKLLPRLMSGEIHIEPQYV